jgi:hypothetical protein
VNRVVALLVAAYSLYVLPQGVTPALWSVVPVSLLGLVTAAGLELGRRWSEPLTYGFLWLIATGWIAIVAMGSLTRRPALVELVPGLALVLACVGCAAVVHRHFRRAS